MADDVTTILCTGDIHLGRHPTRIPSERDGPQFSPRAVWQTTVQAAIDATVDAVVVTGDVVDRENRYFEAYGAFEAGARTLSEAGIPLVVVAGNHDFDVLPRMARDLELDGLHLLGGGGSWERWTLTSEEDGRELVHFEGWSFHRERITTSPLSSYDLDPPSRDVPVLGLLHADLDTPGSDYAPVATSELVGGSVDAWLLGHIHKPGVLREDGPFILYPGSPQPLSPGEPGQHGPWMLRVSPSGAVRAEQLALATVRYDQLTVDATGAGDLKAIPPLVSQAIEAHVRDVMDTNSLELYLPRVRLTGRAEGHAAIQRSSEELVDQLGLKVGSVPVLVERLDVATQPEVDLADLARGQSPVAYLAQLLLDLDQGGPVAHDHEPLVQDAVEAMGAAHGASAYTLLRREGWSESPSREAAVEIVQRQARLLLDTLLEQKEDVA